MRARSVAAAGVALAVATLALSACTPRAGAAAIVDDSRISTTDVGQYVTRNGPTPDAIAAAAQQGQQLMPKSTAVTYLVQQEVFARTLAKTPGGLPSETALNQLHDRAAQTLLGATQTGAALDNSLAANVGKSGFTPAFVPLVLRTIELEQALIDRLKASSIADLAAAVKRANVQVAVNPRFGAWSSTNLDVESGATPSFLKLVAPETTAPSTTPAAG